MIEGMEATNQQKLEPKACTWKSMDLGMYGCSDYVYVTTCKKEYDRDKVNIANFCPNCGGKLIIE